MPTFRRQYQLFLERTNGNHQVVRLVLKPTAESGHAGEVIYRYTLSAFIQQLQIAPPPQRLPSIDISLFNETESRWREEVRCVETSTYTTFAFPSARPVGDTRGYPPEGKTLNRS